MEVICETGADVRSVNPQIEVVTTVARAGEGIDDVIAALGL